MGQQIANTFTSFEIPESERRAAVIFTTLQRQHIHNLISSTAEQIIGLTYDAERPVKFAQDHAFLQGQISVLQHLLEVSDLEESELAKEIRESQEGVQ